MKTFEKMLVLFAIGGVCFCAMCIDLFGCLQLSYFHVSSLHFRKVDLSLRGAVYDLSTGVVDFMGRSPQQAPWTPWTPYMFRRCRNEKNKLHIVRRTCIVTHTHTCYMFHHVPLLHVPTPLMDLVGVVPNMRIGPMLILYLSWRPQSE